ncbi:MAG: spore coat protein CotJB [Eubacteriales bacterium]|nr:spore coat protein CotJB [Eubacteriales bacterium]
MLESMSCCQLLQYINEVSFAVDDILLYLDTHSCDTDALSYAKQMVTKRKNAMTVYARKFGPLTIDCTDERESGNWEWVMQPWPWEPQQKGGYR